MSRRGRAALDLAQDVHAIEGVLAHEQLFATGRRAVDVHRRVGPAVGQLPIEDDLAVPRSLNSSKMTSSMREPVSMSAVPMIVRLPPSSTFRAAPKNRFGLWSAFESTPPERILPEWGTTVLWARARRVIESSRITTSRPCSTSRLAFAITMSATWTRRVAGSSKVEDHLGLHGPLHVRHLLGTLVDQQDDQVDLGIALGDRVRDVLQNIVLPALRRRDQGALSFPDRGDQIDDPRGHPARRRLQVELLLGVSGVRLSKRIFCLAFFGSSKLIDETLSSAK